MPSQMVISAAGRTAGLQTTLHSRVETQSFNVTASFRVALNDFKLCFFVPSSRYSENHRPGSIAGKEGASAATGGAARVEGTDSDDKSGAITLMAG